MKKIRWNPRLVTSLFITLLMCTLDCLAQEVIKGFVKDGNDEPLPGVSVAVKGATNVGTITNVDGNIALMPIKMTYWYSPISEWSARKSK